MPRIIEGQTDDGYPLPLKSTLARELSVNEAGVTDLLKQLVAEARAIRRGLELALNTELYDAGNSQGGD